MILTSLLLHSMAHGHCVAFFSPSIHLETIDGLSVHSRKRLGEPEKYKVGSLKVTFGQRHRVRAKSQQNRRLGPDTRLDCGRVQQAPTSVALDAWLPRNRSAHVQDGLLLSS